MTSYIIASHQPWNAQLASRLAEKTGLTFHLINDPNQLTADSLKQLNPPFIFFPHWSHKIPADIYEHFECVIFHMTDVPYGRGGSPLQNLIVRGHTETKMTALKCVAEMDAGPVYLKAPLSLAGTAQDIFERADSVIEEMIQTIIKDSPTPQPQTGEVVSFKRRKPEESNVAPLTTLNEVYDTIRMLDAEGYPHAFLETEHFKLTFRQATLENNQLTAQVTFTQKEPSS